MRIMQLIQWSKIVRSKNWLFKDTVSIGPITHLSKLLSTIIPINNDVQRNLNGYHFLFANQSNENIGNDGYDNYQAPHANEYFKRRMWVRGSIEFIEPLKENSIITCNENIKNVKIFGNSVFVEILRQFKGITGGILNESRTLVYTNEDYNKVSHEPELLHMSPKSDYQLGITLKLDNLQITKYSFLTYNLHKIHLCKKHAESEGLQDIIAQGPLIITLILQWFNQQFPELTLKTIKYKITNPIYVNHEFSIYFKSIDNNIKVILSNDKNVLVTGQLIV